MTPGSVFLPSVSWQWRYDSIPLSMQRQFPDLTPRHLDHLKTLIAKGANQCARAGDKLPDLLDEYIRATTE